VPVDHEGRMLAGLGIRISGSAMPPKTAIERYLPKLRACAERISARLSDRKVTPLRSGEITA